MMRSRNGCEGCSRKKLKCDETKPTCTRCSSSSTECAYMKDDFRHYQNPSMKQDKKQKLYAGRNTFEDGIPWIAIPEQLTFMNKDPSNYFSDSSDLPRGSNDQRSQSPGKRKHFLLDPTGCSGKPNKTGTFEFSLEIVELMKESCKDFVETYAVSQTNNSFIQSYTPCYIALLLIVSTTKDRPLALEKRMQQLASNDSDCPLTSRTPESIYKLAEALLDEYIIIFADELLFERFFKAAGDMLASNRHLKLEASDGIPQLAPPSTVRNLLEEAKQQMAFIVVRWLGQYEMGCLYPHLTPAILPEVISTEPAVKALPGSTSVMDIKKHLRIKSSLWKELIGEAAAAYNHISRNPLYLKNGCQESSTMPYDWNWIRDDVKTGSTFRLWEKSSPETKRYWGRCNSINFAGRYENWLGNALMLKASRDRLSRKC